MNYKIEFITSYGQFYVEDSEFSITTDSDHFWTDLAFQSRMAVEKGRLGVRIGSYGTVRLELNVLENGGELDMNADHIVEAGLYLHSGTLQILDCPHSHVELTVSLNPGHYRVRINSYRLLGATDDYDGTDYYKMEIWPTDVSGLMVLKQFD